MGGGSRALEGPPPTKLVSPKDTFVPSLHQHGKLVTLLSFPPRGRCLERPVYSHFTLWPRTPPLNLRWRLLPFSSLFDTSREAGLMSVPPPCIIPVFPHLFPFHAKCYLAQPATRKIFFSFF